MNKLLLTFLTMPAVLGSLSSLIMIAQPAHASTVTRMGKDSVCIESPHSATFKVACIRTSEIPASARRPQFDVTQIASNQQGTLDFTDAESDTCIKLFGCDCPRCINALRQLANLASTSAS